MKFLTDNKTCAIGCKPAYFFSQTATVVGYIVCIMLLYDTCFHKLKEPLGNCIVAQCSEPCCLMRALQSMGTTS